MFEVQCLRIWLNLYLISIDDFGISVAQSATLNIRFVTVLLMMMVVIFSPRSLITISRFANGNEQQKQNLLRTESYTRNNDNGSIFQNGSNRYRFGTHTHIEHEYKYFEHERFDLKWHIPWRILSFFWTPTHAHVHLLLSNKKFVAWHLVRYLLFISRAFRTHTHKWPTWNEMGVWNDTRFI